MKTTIINAKIITSSQDMPLATSMSFEQDIITEVSLDNLTGDIIIDMHGKTICPSFFDLHMHPLWIADNIEKFACLPPKIYSIEDCQDAIRQIHTGKWILGWGFDEGKIKEHRLCTKHDLDKACLDYPVIIERTCNHICMCNTKALIELGIDPTHHDGILRENEKFEAFTKIPKASFEETLEHLNTFSHDCLSKGITTISEMLGTPQSFKILEQACTSSIQQDILFAFDFHSIKHLDKLPVSHQPKLHIQGIKILADGSISGQTAWCTKPYCHTNHTGLSTITNQELSDAFNLAKKYKLQLIAHAMGDRAILNILHHKQEDWLQNQPSLRIEHFTMTNKKILDLTKTKHAAVVSQPIFMYAEIESYLKNLSESFKDTCYQYQSIIEHKIPLAFSSDAPATSWADPYNPFVSIASACKRESYNGIDTGFTQRLSVIDAINAYTRFAADIVGINNAGSIQVGQKANFLVLDQDILAFNTKIEETQVIDTYLNGHLVYHKNKEI